MMNAQTALESLDKVSLRIKSYRDSLIDTPDFESKKNALLTESLKKLTKLRYILEKCYSLDAEINAIPALLLPYILTGKDTTEIDKKLEESLLHLEVYCEAFYYTAFRVFKIHEEIKIRFKCIGIRDVRNHLIEHPEVLSQSFGTGNMGNGPTIKNARQQGATPRKKDEMDVFQDKGLFVNFEEFIASLDEKSSTLIKTSA